ncbi:DNA/RNA non-specific endonuclease [Streptomyces sp. NPDC127106]|uniref:DNA/RNA non-specific endonuclease n=1 Tax=Streptomyces sp. NPDC127106 TaxID=3345360 RepID=UPI00362BFE5E
MAATKRTSARPKPSAKEQDELISSLKHFIRTRGSSYLSDPNVSSIGIGYKEKNGKRSKELALQFTVDRKVEPEGLGLLDSAEIPAFIDVDGVRVPTDIVQRSYAPHFLVVAEGETPDRQRRIDPVRPGVSVSNVNLSAGTLGCVVFDRNDGSTCFLSNWHVLNGLTGVRGDHVVQPGTKDDSRTALNHLGRLVRAHLGVAGDCAVSTVTDRDCDPSILDLDVTPARLGEPQIDDKVVKCGRTTGVTHGVVTRPFAKVRIDYGTGVGIKEIECFEIGPDPGNPATDGEISKRGDSGAAWMFKTRAGRPSDVLAGLHFGGESEADTEERALACFPRAVFDELKITLQRPAPEVEPAPGYDPAFLPVAIAPPKLNPSVKDDAVRLGGSEVIPYTHFSLALSSSRRFAFWVAWNIDGGNLKKLDRRGIRFKTDPRLPLSAQVDNDLYKGGAQNRLDRGHVARRADLLWGPLAEAQKANRESFFYTNITPQMDDFNQSARNGIWGHLEDAVFEEVEVDGLRVSVFGGPVFQEDDRLFRGVQIPREFWKVLVFSEHDTLKCKAFLLTQNLVLTEALDLDEFRVFQVKLTEVQARTHIRFATAMADADTLAVPRAVEDRAPLERLSDIDWS